MLKPYVRTSERVLFAFSLAFSLIVYSAIIGGLALAGFAAYKSYQTASTYEMAEELAFEEYPLLEEEAPLEGEVEPVEGEAIIEEFIEDDYSDDEYTDYEDYSDEFYDGGSSLSTMGAFAGPATLAIALFYIIIIILLITGAHILAVGYLMGNGVRVNGKQFPELWSLFEKAAAELGLRKLPAFYLVESGGILNAFATRLFTRNYVAIYADLAERLYEGEPDTVNFIIAHELVHVRRNHSLKSLFTLPAEAIPFLKAAWRRACEYTCDAGGAELSPAGAEKGLILLAAGKKLSARMDADAYLESFRAEKSVWKRIAELFSSHPHLPKRIAVLRKRAQETT